MPAGELKKYFLYLYGFSIAPLMVLSQNSQENFPFQQIEYYDSRQGLNGNETYFGTQDKRGFLWFMTDNGLNRFDGYSFRSWSYKTNDANSLPGGQYWGLTEDKRGILWIAASTTGLWSFDPAHEKFTNYRFQKGSNNSLASAIVNAVVTDNKGMVWIGTDNGLDKYDPQSKTFTHFQHRLQDTASIYSNRIYGLVIDEHKPELLWIVGRSLGLDCFNTQTGKVIRHFDFPFSKAPYSSYHKMLQDSDPWANIVGMKNGNIWLGSNDQGIFGFNAHTGQFVFIKMQRVCKSADHVFGFYNVTEDDTGNLWTTNDNDEVVYYERATKKFYFLPIKKNNIRFKDIAGIIFQDRSRKIWICTNDGLVTIDVWQKKFFNYRHDPTNDNSVSTDFIYGIYRARQGALFVSTSSGIDRFDTKTKSFSPFPLFENGRKIDGSIKWTISQDSKDVVWFAGETGIVSYNPATKKAHQYNLYNDSADLSDIAIFGVVEDKNGKYWAGNLHKGLYNFDPVTGNARTLGIYYTEDSSKVSEVGPLFMDSKGLLYINARQGGFIIFDPRSEKSTVYRHDANNPESVSHQSCHSFIEAKNGMIWFATFGGGINVFNPATNKFRAFTTKEGLSHNMILSLVEDKNGNYWAGTGTGGQVSCLTPPDDPFSPNSKFKFRNYDVSDGLPPNVLTKYSTFCDNDGALYFGTRGGGVVYFHPDSLKDNPFEPTVQITEFRLLNKPVNLNDSNSILETSIEFTKEINLNHRQNTISFSFAALNYIHPEKNQYAYKLENYDKEWIYTDASRRFATYTNLGPGKYIFKVKGSNNDVKWNETATELIIIISPPFWQTVWFKILAVLGLIGIVYFFYRYRIGQILLLQRIRNKIAADLHDDIGSTLNSISIFSEVAKNDPSKRDESLDMIGNSSRKVTEAMSDIVWTINPDNDSFEKIILRMRSLSYNLLRAKDIEFTFRADEDLNNLKLPMDKRKIFYLVFKEILNNLIKHSQASHASFSLSNHENKNITLTVWDNGIGFDATKAYTGNGLNNIKNRANEIRAKLIIDSNAGAGTTIQLIVKP